MTVTSCDAREDCFSARPPSALASNVLLSWVRRLGKKLANRGLRHIHTSGYTCSLALPTFHLCPSTLPPPQPGRPRLYSPVSREGEVIAAVIGAQQGSLAAGGDVPGGRSGEELWSKKHGGFPCGGRGMEEMSRGSPSQLARATEQSTFMKHPLPMVLRNGSSGGHRGEKPGVRGSPIS